MGTKPKTKAEIMKKIADKRARIAQLQAQKTVSMPSIKFRNKLLI